MAIKTNLKAETSTNLTMPEIVNPFTAPPGYTYEDKEINYATKDEYTDKDIKFRILDIQFEAGAGYEGGDRWAVVVRNERGEDEALTFACNEGRDLSMSQAQTCIEQGVDMGLLHLVQIGKPPKEFHVINAVKKLK